MLKRSELFVSCCALVVVLFLSSCAVFDPFAGAYSDTDENVGLYQSDLELDLKNYEGPARNPVIVIHGFMGSKIRSRDLKHNVWGKFTGFQVTGGFSDAYLERLSYPMAVGKTLSELKDDAKAYEMMKDANIRLFGVTIDQSAYRDMLDILISKGFIPKDQMKEKKKKFPSLYTFFYDWRRNNVQNAQQLYRFIKKKRKELQEKYEELYGIKNFDVKFNIVGHSMGGMITRYMLMYGDQPLPEKGPMPKADWRGSKYVERAVIVGTPNLGFLNVPFEMTKGLSIAKGVPAFPPAVIGTWATYYQMLPFPCLKAVKYADDPDGVAVDLYDPQVWIDMKWGLADPKQDKYLKFLLPNIKTPEARRKIALDHMSKCLKKAKQFSQALQVNSKKPDNLALFLFLGDSVPTRKTAVVDRKTGELKLTHMDGGDGVVLTVSARMDTKEETPELPFQSSPVGWHSVVHLNAAHMGITETTGFGDNITYYLMLLPVSDSEKRRDYLKRTLHNSKEYMKYFKNYNKEYK
jgi:pimeloyl-ACP methyl ester carboxylesterase